MNVRALFSILTMLACAAWSFPIQTNKTTIVVGDPAGPDFKQFTFRSAGYDDQAFNFNIANQTISGMSATWKVARQTETGQVAYISLAPTQTVVSATNVYFQIAKQYVPPNGSYQCELRIYSADTNEARSIGRGTWVVSDSLYGDSDATYPFPTNWVDLSDYLLKAQAATQYLSRGEATTATNGINSIVVSNGVNATLANNILGLGLDTDAFATGTPVYVESDPVWSGVSNSIRLGINAAQSTGVAAYAAAASRVQYQDTRGFTNSGGVAIGYGMAGDAGLSVGTSTSGPSCFAGGDRSQATGTTSIAYGVVAKAFGLGAVALGAGGPNAWGDGSISLGYGPDAYGFASVAIGENAEARGVNAVALGGLSTNSRTYSIGYDAIAGHADSVAIGSGSVTTTSNQLAASFSGGYLLIGGPITGDGSGLTNLPSSGGGAAQSPITNNVNGAAFTISNVNVQVVSQLVVGPGNTIGATATNISIVGGAGGNTISNGANNIILGGSAHNVAGGANSGGAAILSGTNSWLGPSSANSIIAGGRQNRIGGSSAWESFIGGGVVNYIANDYVVIGGGYHNSNTTVGAISAVVLGGEFNRANGKYSQVLGGVSNSALATGSAAIGSMGTVAAGGTNSIILQADPLYPATNAAPNSVLVAGRGGLQLAALNGVPWEVGGIRAITNADVRTVTPIRQLAFVYDVGSNAFYIAEGITTNDWQKLTP